ncbi:hypothetical protein ILUMI_07179 [Ignelater luminosus]|uniref:Uncharacterized protein n=1 Tax=Ignelater luminosus TaxID=2038154 RepID=A0A8K0GEM4_IGNLU|nr:hypothetical protein ILUMI_07179 [Ignelater luminosus]
MKGPSEFDRSERVLRTEATDNLNMIKLFAAMIKSMENNRISTETMVLEVIKTKNDTEKFCLTPDLSKSIENYDVKEVASKIENLYRLVMVNGVSLVDNKSSMCIIKESVVRHEKWSIRLDGVKLYGYGCGGNACPWRMIQKQTKGELVDSVKEHLIIKVDEIDSSVPKEISVEDIHVDVSATPEIVNKLVQLSEGRHYMTTANVSQLKLYKNCEETESEEEVSEATEREE